MDQPVCDSDGDGVPDTPIDDPSTPNYDWKMNLWMHERIYWCGLTCYGEFTTGKSSGDDSPYGMPEDLASLLPEYLRSKDFLVCPTFRKAFPEVVDSLHQLVIDSKWYLPPSNAWSSYFLMMPRALDKPPIITVTFREVTP